MTFGVTPTPDNGLVDRITYQMFAGNNQTISGEIEVTDYNFTIVYPANASCVDNSTTIDKYSIQTLSYDVYGCALNGDEKVYVRKFFMN